MAFWALVLWGTVLAAATLYAALVEGPTVVLRRMLSGAGVAAGVTNLAAVGLALLAWVLAGIVLWQRRAAARRGEGGR
jgi:hypothetical protein